jgi:hypothetical protein
MRKLAMQRCTQGSNPKPWLNDTHSIWGCTHKQACLWVLVCSSPLQQHCSDKLWTNSLCCCQQQLAGWVTQLEVGQPVRGSIAAVSGVISRGVKVYFSTAQYGRMYQQQGCMPTLTPILPMWDCSMGRACRLHALVDSASHSNKRLSAAKAWVRCSTAQNFKLLGHNLRGPNDVGV